MKNRKQYLKKSQSILELVQETIRSGKIRLHEASIMKPEYGEGSEFFYKGGISFLDSKGYEEGEIFIVTKTEDKVDVAKKVSGSDTPLKKTIKSKSDGKSYTLSGGPVSFKEYFNHIKAGASIQPKGEDWEALIVVAYNEQKEGPEWNRAKKFWSDHGDEANVLAKKISQLVPSKKLKQLGSSTANLRPDWTGVDKTPKTDVLGDTEHISLKKAGGSQLLSGGDKEIKATFNASVRIMCDDVATPVFKFISDLENKMGKLNYDGTVKSIKQLSSSGKELTAQEMEIIKKYGSMTLNHQELTNDLNEIFNDMEFKKIFCFEAATGTSKFADDKAIANILIEFNPDKGEITKNLPMKSIEDATYLAQNNKFYFSFKSSGNNPYTVLRTSVLSKKQLTGESKGGMKIETLSEIIKSEMKKFSPQIYEYLKENHSSKNTILEEWEMFTKLFDKIKTLPERSVQKIKSIYNSIMERVKNALDIIRKLGKDMFDGLMHFLGLEVNNISIESSGSFPLV